MSVTGIDIAWDRPTIAQIKATGATWVARYFSTDPSKNLTAAEVRDYHGAGLGIVTVWETTTARATQGYQAGIDDANLAEGQRKAVGLPSDMVIHFAVDEDTDWASVEPYFRGASAVLGQQRVGLYGGYRPVEGAHAAGYRYLWQTTAWSGGRWSVHATIRQPGGMTLSGAADFDTAEVADFGQYPRPTTEDIVTPQDIQAIINGVSAKLLAELPFATWNFHGKAGEPEKATDMHQVLDNTLQHSADAAAGVKALGTQLAGLAAPKLSDAQVQALAAQVVPVLVPQLVAAMGHALDGTKP